MKRDMEPVRSILLQVEKADGSRECGQLDFMEHSQDEVFYHIDTMRAHGLIEAVVKREWGGSIVHASIAGLTWEGQDFLDAMRDDRVWSRAKKALADSVGSTTFDVVKSLCSSIATKLAMDAAGIS